MAGYPGACGGCPRRWNSATQAHCCRCHRHFGGVTAFDLHLPPSTAPAAEPCKDPPAITTRAGKPRLVELDGIWRWPADAAKVRDFLANTR